MEARPGTMDVSALLKENEWIGGLAARLIGGAQDAEDLAQDTRLAALGADLRGDRSLRPWLATVTRNGARMFRRSEGSRRALEAERAALDADRAALSPEELIETLETQELVMRTVRELPEDLCYVILATFVEGRTPAEIAGTLDIPAGTVRYRKSEALRRLRERLDTHFGGDRSRTLAALVPAAQLHLRSAKSAAAAAGSASSLTAWWSLMSIAWKLAAAAALCAVLFVTIRAVASPPDPLDGQTATVEHTPEATPTDAARGPVDGLDPVESMGEASSRAPATTSPSPTAPPPGTTVVTLRAVDEDGRPVEGAKITPSLSRDVEQAHQHVLDDMTPAAALALMAGLTRTTDGRGVATWETDLLESGGLITFRAEGPRHGTGEADLLVRAQADDNAVEIVLAPSATVSGRILHADGTTPGRQLVFLVREGAALLDAGAGAVEWIGHDEVVRSAHSAPGGAFRVTGVPEGRYVAVTSALTGHPPARSEAFDVVRGAATEALVLTVEPGELGRPGVLVLGPDGAPVPSARVKLTGPALSFEGTTDDEGWYGIADLYGKFAGGSLEVSDDAGLFHPTLVAGIPEGPRTIEVTLEPRPRVERTFVLAGADGRGVTEHHATLRIGTSRQSAHGEGDRWTVTLPAGGGESLDITAYARGFLSRRIEGLSVDGLDDPHVIELQPAPAISGRVTVDGEPRAGVRVRLYGVWPDGALSIGGNSVSRRGAEVDATRADGEGRFSVFAPGDGEFVLIASGRGLADAHVALGHVNVSEGRPDVEIQAGPGGRLEGTCRDGTGQLQPGARLVLCHPYLETRKARVRRDGTFSFRRVPAGDWFLREVEDFESAMFTRSHEPAEDWVYPSNCRVVHGETTTLDFTAESPLDSHVSGAWSCRGFDAGPWTVTLEQGSSLLGPVAPFLEAHQQERTIGADGRFELPASSRLQADLSVTAPGLRGAFHRTVSAEELPLVLDEVMGLARLRIAGASGAATAPSELTVRWSNGPWSLHARVELPDDGSPMDLMIPAGIVHLDWSGSAEHLMSSTEISPEAGVTVDVTPPP